MSQQNSADTVLAWLWELSDGTRAAVVEHAAAPQWELRVSKNGAVVEHERCDSFPALIAASTAARLRADGRN
ncbi:MAG TPA: hypothetical protein VKE96_01005 [Vicinamibacterales bacterium]|nr:hypothetical protein [Vicinamibacterales bacterium]